MAAAAAAAGVGVTLPRLSMLMHLVVVQVCRGVCMYVHIRKERRGEKEGGK
jgi:hypothetical protein